MIDDSDLRREDQEAKWLRHNPKFNDKLEQWNIIRYEEVDWENEL